MKERFERSEEEDVLGPSDEDLRPRRDIAESDEPLLEETGEDDTEGEGEDDDDGGDAQW